MSNVGLSGQEQGTQWPARASLSLWVISDPPKAEGKVVQRCHVPAEALVCWPSSHGPLGTARCSENLPPLSLSAHLTCDTTTCTGKELEELLYTE